MLKQWYLVSLVINYNIICFLAINKVDDYLLLTLYQALRCINVSVCVTSSIFIINKARSTENDKLGWWSRVTLNMWNLLVARDQCEPLPLISLFLGNQVMTSKEPRPLIKKKIVILKNEVNLMMRICKCALLRVWSTCGYKLDFESRSHDLVETFKPFSHYAEYLHPWG